MKKVEMYDLMVDITTYYPDFEFEKKHVVAWQELLCFARYDDMLNSLKRYAKDNIFKPNVAGLVKYWKGNSYERSLDRAGD